MNIFAVFVSFLYINKISEQESCIDSQCEARETKRCRFYGFGKSSELSLFDPFSKLAGSIFMRI